MGSAWITRHLRSVSIHTLNNSGVDYFWFGLLAAFVVKTGVGRYGGLKAYRKLHLMSLGVMLGEYGAETIWSLVAMITRLATYSISINGRLGWNI
jgi:hypothetical protein